MSYAICSVGRGSTHAIQECKENKKHSGLIPSAGEDRQARVEEAQECILE